MTTIKCCLGCDKRHVGCHGTCAEYLAFRAKRDTELQEHIDHNNLADVIKQERRRIQREEANRRRRERRRQGD